MCPVLDDLLTQGLNPVVLTNQRKGTKGKKDKLRFELGSTQAEAVRLQFYKKFKFS